MAARRSSLTVRVAKKCDLGQRPEATGWLAQAEVPREGLAGQALHLRWQTLRDWLHHLPEAPGAQRQEREEVRGVSGLGGPTLHAEECEESVAWMPSLARI